MTFIICDTTGIIHSCEDCGKDILPTVTLIREDGGFGYIYRCVSCGKKAIVKEFEKLDKLYARINDGKPFFYVMMDEVSDIDLNVGLKINSIELEKMRKLLEESQKVSEENNDKH